ncbi:VOC family protein [Pseudarthrobacter sp. N5]|uniref:VOC family protein n=1 Tax=Pseudarthrobacter sp. N5 TaxID=3418416 RepID=UPI003CF1638E
MLRVRPIHFTSRLQEWRQLLTDLGLVQTTDDGDWQEFDAGSGRVALHHFTPGSAEDGTTAFGVEVGDLAEFARRTNEAGAVSGGTTTELIEADRGLSCRVTGLDGFSFLADPATRAVDGTWTTSPAADPALGVTAMWITTDTAAARQDLANIGARPQRSSDTGDWADFTAKNGGRIGVQIGGAVGAGPLGFEYDGDLGTLLDRLTAAGHAAHIVDESYGRTLHVPNPDFTELDFAELPNSPAGPTIWISERQTDLYGYTEH